MTACYLPGHKSLCSQLKGTDFSFCEFPSEKWKRLPKEAALWLGCKSGGMLCVLGFICWGGVCERPGGAIKQSCLLCDSVLHPVVERSKGKAIQADPRNSLVPVNSKGKFQRKRK